MHDIHKTLYLMAKRDEDLLNEGLKAKVAAAAIIGGVGLGMIPPPGTPAKAPAETPAETAPGTLVQNTPKPPIVAPSVYADKEIREMVMSDEGNKLQAYKDTRGILTVGVGHNLEAPDSEKTFTKAFGVAGKAIRTSCVGGTCLTQEQSEKLFDTDYNSHLQKTVKLIPNLASYPPNVQAAFVSGTYRGHIGDSPTFRKEWNAGNYDAALPEFLNREEYKTPKKNKDGSLVAPGVIIRLERDHKILSDYAASIKPTTTTPTIKKESYKDKIRMYLREEGKLPTWGPLPGRPLPGKKPFGDIASGNVPRDWSQLRTDSYKYNYGEVFGPEGILSPDSATVKEPGDLELSDHAIRTRTDSNMPGVVETIGHRVGSEPFGGILRVRSETNMDSRHPNFKKIETHVYDGGTRIGSFISRFTYGHTHTSSMAHDITNNFNFKKGSNSEELTNRRAMDAGAQEFFQRALNQNSELSDEAIDTNLGRVVENHFNETMGGRRNKKISEYHRGLEGTEDPSDGPGDGSVDQYGDLT